VKGDEFGTACGRCERQEKYIYKVLIGIREEKITFGIPRRRWESNINMNFEEMGWGSWLDSSGLG
jgi:hypothetical protein